MQLFSQGRGNALDTAFFKLESETKQLTLQHLNENPGTEQVVIANQQDAVPALMRSATLLLNLADLTPTLSTMEGASVALWTAVLGLSSISNQRLPISRSKAAH